MDKVFGTHTSYHAARVKLIPGYSALADPGQTCAG